MLIPIGTDVRPRKPPVANWVLIGLNVGIFALTDWIGGPIGNYIKSNVLNPDWPLVRHYLTYQFLHGDVWHLLGNMLFLWIFGNAVCDRMGGLPYVFFYLAGGVCAGLTFTITGDNPMLGASGAIAAVTAAFLVLYPRVRVVILLFLFYFLYPLEIPAILLIVFKIILWDNIIAPSFDQGLRSNVAYSAHLGGYAFGLVVAMALLALRVLPRHPFDLLSLWQRHTRRAGLTADSLGRGGAVRPIEVEEVYSRPLEPLRLTPAERLREEVLGLLDRHDIAEAARFYRELLELDAGQVLPRAAQLEIANHLAQTQRYAEAVHAYELFLTAYPTAADVPQVRLLAGLICNRYLQQYQKAANYLRHALEGLVLEPQRALALQELQMAEARLSPPADFV